MFNKACQVRFLAGRGQTKRGSHARLPGSSLMCCHKTCSWQRLNVQQGRETLGVALPTVPPTRFSLAAALTQSLGFLAPPAGCSGGSERTQSEVHKYVFRSHRRAPAPWRHVGSPAPLPDKGFLLSRDLLLPKWERNQGSTWRNSVRARCQAASPLFNVQSRGFHNLLLKNSKQMFDSPIYKQVLSVPEPERV